MAKFLKLRDDGLYEEVEFIQTSTGVGDAGKGVGIGANGVLDNTVIGALTESTGAATGSVVVKTVQATGKIDPTFLPDLNAEMDSYVVAEALFAGAMINIYNDGTTAKARLACALSPGKIANGFCKESAAVDENIKVYRESQLNNALSDMTPGVVQFLSTIPGKLQESAPTNAGEVVQRCGISRSASELVWTFVTPVVKG